MTQLVEAFVLGNGAILTNVCLLPLYPGLIAFLATGAGQDSGVRRGLWLGLTVLAGVLSLMLIVGWALFLARRPFASLLPVLLPLVYGLVIALGLLMLTGRNPFARLPTMHVPLPRNTFAEAYGYGLLLGPMTLPCAGPIVVSAFVVGAGSLGSLADGLLYFLAFGLGFGWPLAVLPLVALPLQQRLTRRLAGSHSTLTRLAGLLLIAIGLFGTWTEVLPNL